MVPTIQKVYLWRPLAKSIFDFADYTVLKMVKK